MLDEKFQNLNRSRIERSGARKTFAIPEWGFDVSIRKLTLQDLINSENDSMILDAEGKKTFSETANKAWQVMYAVDGLEGEAGFEFLAGEIFPITIKLLEKIYEYSGIDVDLVEVIEEKKKDKKTTST